MSKPADTGSIFERRSIRFPILRIIMLAVLLGIGLALLTDAVLMFDNVRKDIKRSLTAAANAAGTAASAAVVFNDAAAARDVLRMFEAYPEIEAAAVYPSRGPRLASYGKEDALPNHSDAIGPAPAEIAALAATAVVHMPIVVDDLPVGTVYVRAKLGNYWRTYLTTMATTIFVGLSAGALALLLAMRFLDRIILPVRLLAEVARDARLRQDFRPRPIPVADDEIGEMVNNFNALLEEIETSRQALHTYQSELERLVAGRTAELSAAKETAEQANLAKSRFLAAASHDLRQPIQAMRLFQDSLSRTTLDAEQRRIADYLAQSTRSLADILNVLLDVSKLDGGMVTARPETISVRSQLATIDAEFAPLALAKGLRFKLFFPHRDLMVHTDAKLFHGLLRNLIDNAIKYTESGGILVGIRRRGNRLLIQVWDTGIGIAPEHMRAIFDEYFQVSNPQRDSTKGLGLGLAIVRRVAAILGCRIACRSRAGKGSVFEVSVPLAREKTPRLAAKTDGEDASSPLAGIRVIVIEDDPMAAKAVEVSLGSCGMEVISFPSAEAALADEGIEAGDFYIVDYRLPGVNGRDLLDAIRERSQRSIKAVLLTGEIPDDSTPDARFSDWHVLLKPIDLAALVAEIQRQVLPRSAARDAAMR
jgi:signal transduction histidine kinase/ActR/RegA family two-component response regulator